MKARSVQHFDKLSVGRAEAKRSLGQNFLKSREIVDAIVTAADVTGRDYVLEIGPGKGILTGVLLESGARVIAVEKDDDLYEKLNRTFVRYVKSGQLELIHDDILEVFDNLAPRLRSGPQAYKLVANIPYNITGLIFRKFLESEYQPASMTLMVQKEVAERIIAKDGKESVLSISVKAFGTPRYVKTVSRKRFSPSPIIDSAILTVENISRDFFSKNNIDEKKFFSLVKAGFAQKRRMLINNLKNYRSGARWQEIFAACKLDLKIRAERIRLSDWMRLVKHPRL